MGAGNFLTEDRRSRMEDGRYSLSSILYHQAPKTQPSRWTLPEIAGRFVEISASAGSASLTLAFGLVREAQERGEPVGWVTSQESFFYPPDAAYRGVDLAALAVIRVLDAASIPRAERNSCARAASAWSCLISELPTFLCRSRAV